MDFLEISPDEADEGGRALLAELLRTTIEEYFRPISDVAKSVGQNTLRRIAEAAVAKREAELWITDGIKSPTLSFDEVCISLEMNPEVVREKILKITGPERAKIWRRMKKARCREAS